MEEENNRVLIAVHQRKVKVKGAYPHQQYSGSYNMKIKVISQQYNPLLKRKEIIFEVKHEETKGTPSRLEIRKELAKKLKANIELLYIRKVKTKTGTMLAAGEANLYDSPEQVKLVEPEHIITRNMPPEKPTEEKKE